MTERGAKTRPRVAIAPSLPPAVLDLVSARCEVEVDDGGPERNFLLEHAPRASAIVTDSSILVGATLLDAVGPSRRAAT